MRVSFPSSLNGSQADPLCIYLFFNLFSCRIARDYEEVSSSQVGSQRGTPRETPIASSLVASMYVEEIRLFNQVPVEISPEMSDGPTASTIREADNSNYFT